MSIMRTFQTITSELGVPLAEEKTESPATVITFWGIELDSIQQSSRLPDSKLLDLRIRIRNLLQHTKVTLKELQEVAGQLNFACKVIAPSRAFLRWICRAMSG